ncbi:MAG: metallopeptidase family protein [Dehalococcoidales bacterium]
METASFEQLVARAIESLPEEIRESLENVDVIVADDLTPDQRQSEGLKNNETLLGLYEGVPLTKRTHGYSGVVPDKITIFQKPIEASCKNDIQIVAAVQRVVRHEIAHHFGIDDDRLKEIRRY